MTQYINVNEFYQTNVFFRSIVLYSFSVLCMKPGPKTGFISPQMTAIQQHVKARRAFNI